MARNPTGEAIRHRRVNPRRQPVGLDHGFRKGLRRLLEVPGLGASVTDTITIKGSRPDCLGIGPLFESLCGQALFQRMRKHLGWYCKGFPRAAAMRARMFQASSLTDVEHTICDFFGEAVFREVQAASSRQSHATVDTCV